MNRLNHASAAKLVGVGLLAGLLVGCSSKPAQPAAEATTPAATPAAEAAAKAVTATPPDLPKLVAPLRGEVNIDYTKPETKREKDLVVTTVEVKNTSSGAIAGLKVNEYWYDKDGNPVSGSEDRLRKLLMPGDTATLTMSTPYSTKLNGNKLDFSHANGTVKPNLVKSLSAEGDAKK
jgi:uncharacterized protein YcfL